MKFWTGIPCPQRLNLYTFNDPCLVVFHIVPSAVLCDQIHAEIISSSLCELLTSKCQPANILNHRGDHVKLYAFNISNCCAFVSVLMFTFVKVGLSTALQ